MELSVAIQAKVEVTPSNWNFGFQPTNDVESDCFYDFTGSEICYFIIFRTFPLMRCNALSVDFGSFPRIPAI